MNGKSRLAEYRKKKVVHLTRSLLFSILAWEVAIGLFMILRSYGVAPAAGQVTGVTAACVSLVAGFLLGVTDWLSNMVADRRSFRSRSYGFLIAFKGICLLVSVTLIMLCARFVAVSAGIIERGDVLASFLERLTDKTMIPALLFVGSTAVAFSFIRQMITQVGGRVLFNLILGKYHHPKQEDRIFMFLDLKSSTTIAEQLGHAQFSRLLQDCFLDLTDSVVKHDVEIYLYVGDEAVLTWKTDDGIRNSNCINAYYDFQNTLLEKAQYYRNKYGVVPEFKAGVNSGPVTVAEIGVIKKHIAYHGDVLNTAARMEGKCNEYGKKVLVSESLKELLSAGQTLAFELMGNIPLRCKEQSVDIYSVEIIMDSDQ
jgi:adenylate cyclase